MKIDTFLSYIYCLFTQITLFKNDCSFISSLALAVHLNINVFLFCITAKEILEYDLPYHAQVHQYLYYKNASIMSQPEISIQYPIQMSTNLYATASIKRH